MNTFTISDDGYLTESSAHQVAEASKRMAPSIDPLAIEATRMIVIAYGSLLREVAPHRAEFGLSGARYSVLRVLFETQDGQLSMSEIARRLTVTPTNVTQLINGLERDGLVERRRDAADRRVIRIGLTAAGSERFEAVAPLTLRRFHDAFAGLDTQEKRLLIHLLAKLRISRLARPADPRLVGKNAVEGAESHETIPEEARTHDDND
jgi:DNA-binding MarR family transcriptional regulator